MSLDNEHLKEIRFREFPAEAAAFFNAAAIGVLPERSRRALEEVVALESAPWEIPAGYGLQVLDDLRASFARFIKTEPRNIAVTTSTGEVIGRAAVGLDLPKPARVACINGDFPSNVLPWLVRRDADGTPVDLLDPPAWPPTAEWLAEALHPDTAVLTISWVSFSTGARIDAAAIGRLCRERRIFFILDATQGMGSVPLDPSSFHVDVVATSGYKWLLCPYGVSFAYFSPRAIERITPHMPSWRSMNGIGDFGNLTNYDVGFAEGARRFDAGEAGSPLLAIASMNALDVLAEAGAADVYAYNEALVDRFITSLDRDRFDLLTNADPHARGTLVTIGPKHTSAEKVVGKLSEAQIGVSLREGRIRIAFHLFNSAEGVDRLLDVLNRD